MDDKKTGFKLEPMRDSSRSTIEFSGNKVVINRSHIGTEDSYVSRNAHAQFEFKNGQWYLSNLSANKALFIQVQGEIPIPDNCIIVLGTDNFYTFHANNSEAPIPTSREVNNCKQCWHPLPHSENICPGCGYNNQLA